jgi:hypothetical protein
MPSNNRCFCFTGARLALDRSLPGVEFPSLTLNIRARSQCDRHPAGYEYERYWSCEVMMERGFSKIRDGGPMPFQILQYADLDVKQNTKMRL